MCRDLVGSLDNYVWWKEIDQVSKVISYVPLFVYWVCDVHMYTCSPACTRACGCECMCMHCLWPPKAGKGYLPQYLSTFCFGPGYVTDLELTWLAGLIAQSAPAIFLCLSPRAGIPGMCKSMEPLYNCWGQLGIQTRFLTLGQQVRHRQSHVSSHLVLCFAWRMD